MTLPRFATVFWVDPKACKACDQQQRVLDVHTLLCVECWRVVVLAPAALKTREPAPRGEAGPNGATEALPNAARVLG